MNETGDLRNGCVTHCFERRSATALCDISRWFSPKSVPERDRFIFYNLMTKWRQGLNESSHFMTCRSHAIFHNHILITSASGFVEIPHIVHSCWPGRLWGGWQNGWWRWLFFIFLSCGLDGTSLTQNLPHAAIKSHPPCRKLLASTTIMTIGIIDLSIHFYCRQKGLSHHLWSL